MKYLQKVSTASEAVQNEFNTLYSIQGGGVVIKKTNPQINPNVTTVIYSDGSRKEFITANYISGITVQDPTYDSIPNPTDQLGDLSEAVEVYIGNNVTLIGSPAFANGYELGAPYVFPENKITTIHIPNSVTTIENLAFSQCHLTSVTIPDSVTSIGGGYTNGGAFVASDLLSVTIGSGVTCVQGFNFCSSLTSVIIGNGVTSIGNGAFQFCSSLTSITIPNSVTSIGNGAFYYCM